MTADRPTTTEVDFFTWNRDFHGIRPRGTDDMRPGKISTGVARVALAIAAHVNGKTGEAAIGTRRLAQAAQVSTGTIANALPILESLGWVQVERSKKANTNSDAVNIYRLTSPVAALRSVDNSADCPEGASGDETGVPQEMRQGASGDENELRLLTSTSTTRDQKISPDARAGADSATTTDELIELPTTWKPNRTHRVRAGKLGMDVDALAADFPARMAGKREKNWDRAFGRFLNDSADGCADTTFPYPATEVDLFAPSTSSVVDLGPDPTAQALDWIAPALWAEGLHPDALTADERAEVVLSHDPGVDPRDVASRIRANRVVSQVAKHVGPMSSDEVAHVVDGVAHDYSDVDGLALDIRNARRGKALMIRAGDDPAGKDVGRLAAIWLECAEEDGEPLPGDPLDRYRSPIPA